MMKGAHKNLPKSSYDKSQIVGVYKNLITPTNFVNDTAINRYSDIVVNTANSFFGERHIVFLRIFKWNT